MSTDIIITHDLPPSFLALNHETLDEAMTLCERAHAISIPSAKLDEAGCRSAVDQANRLYNTIDHLSKRLEEHRLAEGRRLSAVKAKIDDAVKAATQPLEDQRAKLGNKLKQAGRELEAVVERKRREAEAERARIDADRRAAAEAADRARVEAEQAAAAAAEAARKAAEATPAGEDPLPDDTTAVEAERTAEAARTAQVAADQARAVAVEKIFEPARETFVPAAPKLAVKTSTSYQLQVDDLALVPREVGGVPLFKLDEAAALRMAKELARVGKTIPGLTLIAVEGTASNRRGSAFAV